MNKGAKVFPQGSWLEETLELLRKRTGSFERISKETGLGLFWLNRVANGHIPDPSVNRVQMLHDYLVKEGKRERASTDAVEE